MRDLATIWQEFLKIVREEAGSRVVETWFKAVRMRNWDAQNKIVHVEAPNAFVKSWISTHYMQLFERHLSRLLNEPYVNIRFTHARKSETPTQAYNAENTSVSQHTTFQPARLSLEHVHTQRAEKTRTRRKASPVRVRGPLNSDYLFDTFVVGSSNMLAFSAAHTAASDPGNRYNPLYIYGGSGLGKTHLLHAVGNYIRSGRKKALILYQSADHFVSEFISAVRSNSVYDFEARYKDVDILLFDDVQCISHKEQTQEMFFHIFNTLYQANKQVVVTSNTFPSDICGLNERIRSRLEGGLIADIQEPSWDMKISILQKKASHHNEELSPEVAQYIASYQFSSVRELEAALLRVFAYSSLTKQPVTQDLIGQVFHSQRIHQKPCVDSKTVATTVARCYRYALSDLRSAKRNKDIAFVRHVAMYCMKQYTSCSLHEIAAFFSRKDHTTVLHAYEKINTRRQNDVELEQMITLIERKLIQASAS